MRGFYCHYYQGNTAMHLALDPVTRSPLLPANRVLQSVAHARRFKLKAGVHCPWWAFVNISATDIVTAQAQQLKQQLRSALVAGQWRGDTALTLPLFWRRSTVSPVFFGRYPRSSLHSFVPPPPPRTRPATPSPSLISLLASVDVKQNRRRGAFVSFSVPFSCLSSRGAMFYLKKKEKKREEEEKTPPPLPPHPSPYPDTWLHRALLSAPPAYPVSSSRQTTGLLPPI